MVTAAVDVPTIGIGAGPDCDGQVLVFHDVLGIEDRIAPKFVRRYADLKAARSRAVGAYAADVRTGAFPGRGRVVPPLRRGGRDARPVRPRGLTERAVVTGQLPPVTDVAATTARPSDGRRGVRTAARLGWCVAAGLALVGGLAPAPARSRSLAVGRPGRHHRRPSGPSRWRSAPPRRHPGRHRRGSAPGVRGRTPLRGFGEVAATVDRRRRRPPAWSASCAAVDAEQRHAGPDGGHRPGPGRLRRDGVRVRRGRRRRRSGCATRRCRCRSPTSTPTGELVSTTDMAPCARPPSCPSLPGRRALPVRPRGAPGPPRRRSGVDGAALDSGRRRLPAWPTTPDRPSQRPAARTVTPPGARWSPMRFGRRLPLTSRRSNRRPCPATGGAPASAGSRGR